MDLKDLNARLPSGRVRKAGRLPLPREARVTVVALGPGVLERFLASPMLAHGRVRAVVEPLRVELPSRGRKAANPALADMKAAAKEGRVPRVVVSPDSIPAAMGYAVDAWPQYQFAEQLLAGASPKVRHEGLLSAVRALAPVPRPDDVVLFVMAAPPVEKTPGATRLAGELKAVHPVDHALVAQMVGSQFVPGATILLIPAEGPADRVTRVDVTDHSTAGRSLLGAALDRVAAAMAPGVAPPAEEPELPQADSAGPSAPAPSHGVRPQPEGPAPSRAAQKLLAAQAAAAVVTRTGEKATVTSVLGGERSPKAVSVNVPDPEAYLSPQMTSSKFQAVDVGYLQGGLMDRDLVLALTSLSRDSDNPIFLESIERTDISDALNAKEELGVTMRDLNGRPHRFRFELPLVTRDGRLYLNGEYWDIQKQILAKPVIKVKPDEVLITTAYNKAVVTRFGASASPRTAGLRAALLSGEGLLAGVKVRSGEAARGGSVNSVEFDDMGRQVVSVDTPRASFAFSRDGVDRLVAELAPWAAEAVESLQNKPQPDGSVPISSLHAFGAERDGGAVYLTDPGGTAYVLRKGARPELTGSSMAGIVTREAIGSEDAIPALGGRKYAYTRVRMLMRQVPLIAAVGAGAGLSEILRRYGTRFQVVDAEAFRKIDRRGRDYVRFEDSYLLYEPRLRDSLLLNGLKEVGSENHPFSAFEPKGDGWLDYFAERFGTSFAKKVRNFELGLVDPISAEVLRDEGIPDDFGGLMLYCNTLLEGNQHRAANDLANYRIRGLEVVNSILYSVLQREAEKARATAGRAGRPPKLSVAPSEVINQVLQSSNVNTSSDLNPLLEAELRGRAAWTGGGGGMGNPEMVTKEMRAFHPSMRGVFGFYSPDSQSIGVSRSLSYQAAVNSARGYLDPGSGENAGQLLALGELMAPFTSQHSDPPRIGMQSKQATHTMPVMKSSPMLVGSGAERALAHVIGNTFAYKARAAGSLQRVDLKNAVAVIAHDDGSTSLVDLSARSVKNSVGGGGNPLAA